MFKVEAIADSYRHRVVDVDTGVCTLNGWWPEARTSRRFSTSFIPAE